MYSNPSTNENASSKFQNLFTSHRFRKSWRASSFFYQWKSKDHTEIRPSARKRDQFRSYINYYIHKSSTATLVSSESATLVTTDDIEDDKYIKFDKIISTAQATAIETRSTHYVPSISEDEENQTLASSKRHTFFRKLRLIKPSHSSYTYNNSIGSDISYSNSGRLTKKETTKSLTATSENSQVNPKLSIRQKIRNRLALKPKPSVNELDNDFSVIPPDIIATITECVLDKRSLASNDDDSTVNLNVDIEDSEPYLKLEEVPKTPPFIPIYQHSFEVIPPPKSLPRDQHAKWERRQMLKHTARTFDYEKWKSKQSLLDQENSPKSSNFVPINKDQPESMISPTKLFENVGRLFNNMSLDNTIANESFLPVTQKLGVIPKHFHKDSDKTTADYNSSSITSKRQNSNGSSIWSSEHTRSIRNTFNVVRKLSFSRNKTTTKPLSQEESHYAFHTDSDSNFDNINKIFQQGKMGSSEFTF